MLVPWVRVFDAGATYIVGLIRKDAIFLQPKSFLAAQGRKRLVFFENDDDWNGRLVNVRMTSSGAWSMQGELTTALPSGAPRPEREFIPLLSN